MAKTRQEIKHSMTTNNHHIESRLSSWLVCQICRGGEDDNVVCVTSSVLVIAFVVVNKSINQSINRFPPPTMIGENIGRARL
jgi:hypothetical protein